MELNPTSILVILFFLIPKTTSNSMELNLESEGSRKSCIDPVDHQGYCLSLKLDGWQIAKTRAFKCYLKDELVYNCSSNRLCTDHGNLLKNTRPIEAVEGCDGIPFANINHDSVGEYICHLSDDPAIKASFKLYYCYEKEKLNVRLLKNNKEVECIRPETADTKGYCLAVSEKGDYMNNFYCSLNGEPVYTCQTPDQCQGKGILQESKGGGKYTIPRDISNACWGIPFVNMDIKMIGNYSCYFDTGNKLINGSYEVKVCHQNSFSEETTQTDDTDNNPKQESGNNFYIIFGVGGVVLAIIVFGIIIGIFIYCRRQKEINSTSPKENKANSVELDDLLTSVRVIKANETDFSDEKMLGIK